MKRFSILVLLMLSFNISADDNETLTVERIVSNNIELAFPNDRNITAKPSDFELVNYIIMSNELGERWAVITLKNTTAGTRTLENSHLIALFANGVRKSPQEFKLSFEGKETQSVTVAFGENKFPILSINTETEI